jgi:hypothetical protein
MLIVFWLIVRFVLNFQTGKAEKHSILRSFIVGRSKVIANSVKGRVGGELYIPSIIA